MKWIIAITVAALLLTAIKWAFLPFLPWRRLPRHRVRYLRLRLRLRLHPGAGHATVPELWLRWGRLTAFRRGRQTRRSLPFWQRALAPASAYSFLVGRAHYRHQLRMPLDEHAIVKSPPRGGKTGWLASVILRRRAVRGKYGRRNRSGDPEYGIKGLLARNLEHLSPAQFARVMDTLGSDAAGQEIITAWIGKEKLRDVLNLRARVTGSAPCERDVRSRLFTFYDWRARNDDVPELLSLARTVSRWEDEIVAAVLTRVTNATSESLNRLAKLQARLAYGFRNPVSQRRRVRIACTRGQRRRSQTATSKRTRPVTEPKPHPGYG